MGNYIRNNDTSLSLTGLCFQSLKKKEKRHNLLYSTGQSHFVFVLCFLREGFEKSTPSYIPNNVKWSHFGFSLYTFLILPNKELNSIFFFLVKSGTVHCIPLDPFHQGEALLQSKVQTAFQSKKLCY